MSEVGVAEKRPAYLSQPPLSLEEQAERVEEHGLTSLLFCPNSWALRHRFINEDTGEVVRARCDSWRCPYCGPRKVDQWRQLVKAAEPVLFVTFSHVGKTVEEASRVLTTIVQYLRRGSKGRGKGRVGARPAYPIEWFAVLERHSDFERVGFHWHVLVKGVDYIPHDDLREALRSATKGRAYIAHVERIRGSAIGYVTKYLTKQITAGERGLVEEERAEMVPVLEAVEGAVNDQGKPYEYRVKRIAAEGPVVEEQEVQVVRRMSKARRIRYSRHFFPEAVEDLRRRLFGGEDEKAAEGASGEGEGVQVEEQAEQRRSSWALYEAEPLVEDGTGIQEKRRHAVLLGIEVSEMETYQQAYERRRRVALLEALEEMQGWQRRISRRIINMWSYQRDERREAS